MEDFDITDSSCMNTSKEFTEQYYEFGFKYILIGNADVGKTSILSRFIYNTFKKNKEFATIGVEYGSKII
jgi:GTPase SAR1 family protein